MNKDELIEILQERSQEAIDSDLYDDSKPPKTESKYLQKFKLRRRQDKERALLILIVIILLSALAFLIYKQSKHDTLFSADEYISKSSLDFNSLPSDKKEPYILRSSVEKYQEQLQNRDRKYIKKLEANEKDLKAKITKLGKQTPANFEELFNPSNKKIRAINKVKLTRFDGRGCYDEKPGSYLINKNCQIKITKYLKSVSKRILKIEIIPVIDVADNKSLFKNIRDKATKSYLIEGLARKRILQGAKLVQKTLGKDIIVSFANFSVNSNKKRGVIIRTYFK